MSDGGEQGWLAYLVLIVSLFAMMNPLYAVPTFLHLTQDMPEETRRAIPLKTAIASFLIMVVVFFAGEAILRLFSISLPALRISGGLVVFAMAWSMVRGGEHQTDTADKTRTDGESSPSIALIPLALPLTAGPGAMSLMIVVATYGNPLSGQLAIVFAVFLVCLVVWLTLKLAPRIRDFLGESGMDVVGRLMGLILLALAVEFITTGLAQKFPGWL